MEPTRHFERTLFHDRSPAANEHYELSANNVFDADYSKTEIPVCVQSHHTIKHSEAGGRSDCGTRKGTKEGSDSKYNLSKYESNIHASDDEDDNSSIFSQASSTALSTAIDQRQADFEPPIYPGPPKLTLSTLRHSEIEAFAHRTRHDFRVFYLQHQSHSFSRLRISKPGFETLMKSCHVFPRFHEYVTGFGRKSSESEVGPSPLKFRPLYTINNNGYRAFGRFQLR